VRRLDLTAHYGQFTGGMQLGAGPPPSASTSVLLKASKNTTAESARISIFLIFILLLSSWICTPRLAKACRGEKSPELLAKSQENLRDLDLIFHWGVDQLTQLGVGPVLDYLGILVQASKTFR
jgi:hypothetical protein